MFEDRWSVVQLAGRVRRARRRASSSGSSSRRSTTAPGRPKRVSQNGIFLLAPTMLEYGTDGAEGALPAADGLRRRDLVPGLVRARRRQRPGRHPLARRRATPAATAGSSTARRPGPAAGAFAEWCFGIFRTDPEAERHRGLTYFLVAMDSPGVTVRPIPQIDGETGFAEIFFDNVEVPEDQVLGEVGAGWSVAMATAGSERGLSLRSPAPLHRGSRPPRRSSSPQRGGPAASADAVAQAHMDAEAYQLHTYWTATKVAARATPSGPEASCNKIFWSETDVAIHTAALDLLGPEAELLEAGAPGEWLDGYLFSLAGPIYAGTQRDPAQRGGRAPARAARGLSGGGSGLRVHRGAGRAAPGRAHGARHRVHRRRAARLRAGRRGRPRRALPATAGPCWPSWGRPGSLVPEAADGLGPERRRPGGRARGGGLGRPARAPARDGRRWPRRCWPPCCPTPAAAAALAALVAGRRQLRRRRHRRRRPAGSTSPTAVSADGMLRTPRVVGARDADLLLLACRDPDSGWQLHAVPAGVVPRASPRRRSSSPRDLSTRALAPGRRTRCWPTASRPRRRRRCWPTAPPPARPRSSSAWPTAC